MQGITECVASSVHDRKDHVEEAAARDHHLQVRNQQQGRGHGVRHGQVGRGIYIIQFIFFQIGKYKIEIKVIVSTKSFSVYSEI